ncbi:MAG: J domain-containing protein [Desulfobacteraceae bacterium]
MDIRESYRILEVHYGASLDEVKQGYKDMVRVWHPDRFNEDPRLRKKAEEKLKEVNRAYGDLMAVFAREMALSPRSNPVRFPGWWRKGIRGIGLVVILLLRLIYDKLRRSLYWTEPGRIFQILGGAKRRTGVADPKRSRPETPARKKGPPAHGKRGGGEPDFGSVFDEVARERRRKTHAGGRSSR